MSTERKRRQPTAITQHYTFVLDFKMGQTPTLFAYRLAVMVPLGTLVERGRTAVERM